MTGKELFEMVKGEPNLVYALTQEERWDLGAHCAKLATPFYRRRRSPPRDVCNVMTALEFAAEAGAC